MAEDKTQEKPKVEGRKNHRWQNNKNVEGRIVLSRRNIVLLPLD
jgi:hypothetical protein